MDIVEEDMLAEEPFYEVENDAYSEEYENKGRYVELYTEDSGSREAGEFKSDYSTITQYLEGICRSTVCRKKALIQR